jgi:hypothetical protein
MTELEKLTMLMDEHSTRAVRLGYALGFLHADNEQDGDLDPQAPEFRVLEELGFGPPAGSAA